MVVRINRRNSGSRVRVPAARAFAMALAVALGGCSVMQKADVFDWFGSDDKPPDQANKPLSADEPYPNLADVPGRPARPPAIDRDKIAQSLVADRENAQYTEDVLRRAPDTPSPLASASPAPASPAPASPAPAPMPSAPPAVAALPAPAPVASAPLPPVASAPPAPPPSVPPPSAQPASAPAVPVVAPPPTSAYVPPAQAPLDPNAPPIAMVNNRPVVSAGFYGTEPPPTPPPSSTPPTAATFGPLQRVTVPPPPAVSTTALPDVKPGPVAVARADNVAIRATEPAAAPPPLAPTEIAQIPNAGAPVPYQPAGPAPMPQVAALPPAGPSTGTPTGAPSGTPPDQLDRALRQAFPDAASQGVDALAATIYFGEGAAGLTEDDRAILREVARLHRERGGTVRVVGYASPEASGGDVMARRLANLEVSTRRADAVSRELARFGVPAGAITTSAGGAPTVPGTAGASFGAAGQRRVDIYLDY
jgi:outer membrane protein OmpA-like peptidoglycan-associated protein